LFNKEKRQEKRERREAVKAELKEQIKGRPTFAAQQQKLELKSKREEQAAQREGMVAERLQQLHAGGAPDDVVQLGSDLLYMPVLSGIQLQIHEQQSKKDKCFTRWTVYARHDKEFLGMAPTNRDVKFGGVSVSFLDGETITQEIHYFDMVALLQQIQAP
jgi:predicted ester cyclase